MTVMAPPALSLPCMSFKTFSVYLVPFWPLHFQEEGRLGLHSPFKWEEAGDTKHLPVQGSMIQSPFHILSPGSE